jgi:hypothetical protein
MKPIKVVTPFSGDPEAPTQNLLGLGALAAELAAEGISVRDLFARTGVDAAQLEDPHARISHRQRLAIYRNAKSLPSDRTSDCWRAPGSGSAITASTVMRWSRVPPSATR